MQNNKEQAVANQFIWLLQNEKESVIKALKQAGIDVNKDASPIKIKEIVSKAVDKYNNARDEVSKNAIFNISQLISKMEVTSSFNEPDEDEFLDEDSNEEIEDLPFDTSKYGKYDYRREPKWYEKFKLDDVLKVGNALIGAFGSGRIDNDAVNQPMPQTPPRRGVSTGKIIGFSLLGLILIGSGVVVYRMYKKNG
jgi:hypothetical protein